MNTILLSSDFYRNAFIDQRTTDTLAAVHSPGDGSANGPAYSWGKFCSRACVSVMVIKQLQKFFGTLAFCLLAIGPIASISSAQQQDSAPLEIGAILPLTGPSANYAIEANRALKVFEQLSNLKFTIEDGQCGAANAAVTAAQRLVAQRKLKILLLGCSGEVLQVAPILERQRVVSVCALCGSPKVRDAGEYAFRTYLDFRSGARLLAEYAARKNFTRIAIVTESNAFTNSIETLLKEEARERIAFSQEVSPAEQDFRSLLAAAKAQSPDALYLNAASPASYQLALKQAKAIGFGVPILSYFNPGEKTSVDALGAIQNGVVYFDTPDISSPTPKYQLFLRKYAELYPEGIESAYLLASAYNAIAALEQAIAKVGSDSDAVREALLSSPFSGAEGDYTFDSAGDLIGPRYVLREIVDGKPALLRE